jgi:hypothetical protein
MKEKNQIIALLALTLVGAAVWFWNSHQNPIAAGAGMIAQGYTPMNVENPAIQIWKIRKVQKTEYKSNGRDPFSAVAPPPPAPKTPKPGEPGGPSLVPPPPPPPELPAKFYGYGTIPNGTARRAFLTDGDEVYIVGEGDTFLSRYRILKIGNATIEFEEIASGRQGKANLEDAGPNT